MGAIDAEDVVKTYDDTVALDGVTLSIDPGEIFALVGPNAAGKTTLIRCLTGTTPPDDGRVALDGHPPDRIDHDRLSLLPQEFTPPGRLTPRELIAYYADLYDHARPTTDILEAVGLTDAADTRYEDLSGGQRRRTLVGIALVNDPDLLFLDEPTTGIDPAGRRTVWDLVEALQATGTTVLLTTHSMEEVDRLADRVGILDDGRLITAGTPADLVAAHGGPSRLTVETTESLDHLGLPTTRTTGGFVIRDVEPGDLPGIITTLEDAGVTYDALTWRSPDLETVYLSLTDHAPEPDAATESPHPAPVGDLG